MCIRDRSRYVPPKPIYYAITTHGDPEVSRFECEELVVKPRDHELPAVALKSTRKRERRKFNKALSVFKDFKEDTPNLLKAMFELDFKYTRIDRIANQEEELNSLRNLIRTKYYWSIINIFMTYNALSQYPSLTWIDFTNFCKEAKLVDKYTQMDELDRLFVATNFEVVKLEDNPDRQLCRYELSLIHI
eukprot:TRINITY_DN28566_c0_g2_i1.p1 TRINITY_DN28566_c0_g2~~TRINITY_DN28566_c0_g2_i1.p1  ORF type:complete len:209 (-),score=43.14 TRINITY_DN28566_c0_g2_i1:59-625(-)